MNNSVTKEVNRRSTIAEIADYLSGVYGSYQAIEMPVSVLKTISEEFERTKGGESGYSHTGAFADKPISNNYVWEAGEGINYTATDVSNETWKVFSLSRAVHDAVDNPYWSIPTPTGNTGIGLFQGANLPDGISTLVDYDYVFNDNYDPNGSTGFEGSTGRSCRSIHSHSLLGY